MFHPKEKIMEVLQMLTNRAYYVITYISTAAHFELFKPIDMCQITVPMTRECDSIRKIQELKFEGGGK